MTGTFSGPPDPDPRSPFSLPGGENTELAGDRRDFDAILSEARRTSRCAECGRELSQAVRVSGSLFCTAKHRYAFRDRRRYAADPEGARARARAYYLANRELVLARAAARRGKPRPPENRVCSECGGPLSGRQRVVCGQRCRDARYRRQHPDEHAANEARKVERRREKRKGET